MLGIEGGKVDASRPGRRRPARSRASAADRGAGDGPALGGATGSAGLGGTSGDEPAQPPARHGHLEPARPGGFGAVLRRSHSRRGFGGHSQQQAEPGSRGEAGLSSGDEQGSVFQRLPFPKALPLWHGSEGPRSAHAPWARFRRGRPAVQQESSPAAGVHQGSGCGPQALPAFTLIEEVAELKERFICSPLALQRLQLSASIMSTFFFSCLKEQ